MEELIKEYQKLCLVKLASQNNSLLDGGQIRQIVEKFVDYSKTIKFTEENWAFLLNNSHILAQRVIGLLTTNVQEYEIKFDTFCELEKVRIHQKMEIEKQLDVLNIRA